MRARSILPALALAAALPACSVLTMGRSSDGTPPENLTVKNSAGETLFYLYARPSGSDTWSSDLLEGNAYTMSDGETGSIRLPASRSCTYDFRGTNLGGTKQFTAMGFNVCRNGTLTVGTLR